MTEKPITQLHEPHYSQQEDYLLSKWQKRLLPLMRQMVIGLTFFFFIASFVQLFYLHRRIEKTPKLNINESFSYLNKTELSSFEELISASRFKALTILEANALERRYHQANVLLMSRVWVRYLGFVTGMIIALVGAAFILGKLRTPSSELGAKVQVTEFSLKSSSPGIVLTTLGVILMLTTIITHNEIEVRDFSIYIRGDTVSRELIKENKKPQLNR